MSKQVGRLVTYECANCHNQTFEVREVLVTPSPMNRKTPHGRVGRYRCVCTACGLQQTFTSLHPDQNEYGN